MDNCKNFDVSEYMYAREFSLNDYVYVHLTEYGKKVLYEYYEKSGVCQTSVRKLYQMRKDRILIQAWELAHIFGPKLYNGATESVFVCNSILIPPEKSLR